MSVTINPTPEHRQELRALFDEVVATALNDSYASESEFSCTAEHGQEYAAERAKIEELQAAFPALLDHIERLEAVARDYLADAERWKFDGPGVRSARLALNQEQEQG